MSTTATKCRPILFSGEMVRAILEGRKTQTRRVVKPQPANTGQWDWQFTKTDSPGGSEWLLWSSMVGDGGTWKCPYGSPGDTLWVRETWGQIDCKSDNPIDSVLYKADAHLDGIATSEAMEGYWRPSIHMPRWASRLTLEVTGVRVERLQEIAYGDCIAEGCDMSDVHYRPGWDVSKFRETWNQLNARRGYPWESNPWVWVIEFKKLEETS